MIYLKSSFVGIATAIAAAVLWILAAFALPIFIPLLLSRLTGGDGSGSGGAIISSGSILVAALVGFTAGFYWRFRQG